MSTPILGVTVIREDTAKQWCLSRGGEQWFANSLPELYWDIAPMHGVRPDVAYVQACKETGFGRYGRAVTPQHHNYCGLKVRNPGADDAASSHMMFHTPEVGVQAHIEHLALYAGALGYPRTDPVDPRHFNTLYGTATNVAALSGKWAPSKTYGDEIEAGLWQLWIRQHGT